MDSACLLSDKKRSFGAKIHRENRRSSTRGRKPVSPDPYHPRLEVDVHLFRTAKRPDIYRTGLEDQDARVLAKLFPSIALACSTEEYMISH